MDLQHGTWGERIRTFETDNALVTLLFLKPNKRCSWHSHKHAYNQFTVVSGKLGVKTEIGPKAETQTTILTDKQSFTVGPDINHEFITYDSYTVVEEVAYVKYDSSDIWRLQLGGDTK